LVDLNLQAGDADSMLGLEPAYSISELVRSRARVDDSMLASFLTNYSATLSLLAAPPEAEGADDITPQHVLELMHILRARFSCVVLDLQHTFDPITVEALSQADDVLLLMTLDIPGIRSAKRTLRLFDRFGFPRQKTHVVINRWTKQTDVALQQVEKHLDERLLGFIPNDYKRAIGSINLGQPLVEIEPGSKISLEIKRIATAIAGQGAPLPPAPRKGFLRSVFSREPALGALNLGVTLDEA
ncbi:MAG TPA: hypothetical protein VEA38_19020, partial [Terriglobales bacterium]|nr:hypothetical protein [Terriglobales bacterium]